MKKLWVALAMMLALLCWGSAGAQHYHTWGFIDLGTQHASGCLECGYIEWVENHYASCATPTTCWTCGKENAQILPEEILPCEYVYVAVSESQCSGICEICGKEGPNWPQYHETECWKDQTVCRWCGTTGLIPGKDHNNIDPYNGETIRILHSEVSIEDLGDQHRKYCTKCKGEYIADHNVWCDDPTYCAVCKELGHEISKELMNHNWEWEYVNLGKMHAWGECTTCGYTPEGESHWAMCNEDTSVCAACSGTENIEIRHEPTRVVNLGNQHQTKCESCGEAMGDAENHVVFCDEPGVCYICEFAVTVKEEDQRHDYSWVDVGKAGCKYECKTCGYVKYEVGLHEVKCNAANSVCGFCGADLSGYRDGEYNVAHDYSWVDIGRTGCQYECAACGHVKEGPYGHWVWCDGDACWNCRVGENVYDASDYQVYHPDWKVWIAYLSATQHGIGCEACGASAIEDHYAYCDGDGGKTCYACGGTDLEIPTEYIYHDYNGSGICKLCGKDKNAPAELPGDADGNSRVTLNDAIAILEGTVSNDANADVNGDGAVDANDALRILQYMAGWNVTLK